MFTNHNPIPAPLSQEMFHQTILSDADITGLLVNIIRSFQYQIAVIIIFTCTSVFQVTGVETSTVGTETPMSLIEQDWVRQAEAFAKQKAKTPERKNAAPSEYIPVSFNGPYPVQHVMDRGRLLAADLKATGVNTVPFEKVFDEIAVTLAASAGQSGDRDLYFRARRNLRALIMSNPLLKFDKLLFVKRFTQESAANIFRNHLPWNSRPGGDLCVLTNPFAVEPTRWAIREILAGQLGLGHVHGMDLWWDGDRIVFGYAKSKSSTMPNGWKNYRNAFQLRKMMEPVHLFEIGVDGKKLRQLTQGEWSDVDPTYLANGDICFVSERCGISVECNEGEIGETIANLYVMKPDGTRIRRMSANKTGDYYPHALDDGTISYTRWEYHERWWEEMQPIWTVRPDGTYATALFKQHLRNPLGLEDVRSIPGSNMLVALATGHHSLPMGPICLVDPRVGMNNARAITVVTPGVVPNEGQTGGKPVASGGVVDWFGAYQTPWALSEKYFLVSYGYGPMTSPYGQNGEQNSTDCAIYLIDIFGNKEIIYKDPRISSSIPIPLLSRTKPPILPDTTDPTKSNAVCMIYDASYGVTDIKHTIKYIRISEPLPWPFDNVNGDHRYGGNLLRPPCLNWTAIRVIGTVPVETDGSAHFQVPADTAVYFQILDGNHQEIRRMRSHISFQPGEVRSCVGCHESRTEVAHVNAVATAFRRPPSIPVPPPWGDVPISFTRHVQPVLDKHCVACHSGLKPASGLDFSGGLTIHHNRAYDTLMGFRGLNRNLASSLVVISDMRSNSAITQPYQFGSHRSKLLTIIENDAHRKRLTLNSEDHLRLVTWMDSNAIYHDRFLRPRDRVQPYDLWADMKLAAQINEIHTRRCMECHKPNEITRLDWIDLRSPDRSLFLTAPLAKEVGGTGKCKKAVYATKQDPDYLAIQSILELAVKKALAAPRRDLPKTVLNPIDPLQTTLEK